MRAIDAKNFQQRPSCLGNKCLKVASQYFVNRELEEENRISVADHKKLAMRWK